MRSFTTAIAIVLLIGQLAIAQNHVVLSLKYVVELTCEIFDRDLTEAEDTALQKYLEDTPKKLRGAMYEAEKMRMLRSNTTLLATTRASLIVSEGESNSHTFSTLNIGSEAHVRVIEVVDGTCETEVQWGTAYRVNDISASVLTSTMKLRIPLRQKRHLSSGGTTGGMAFHLVAVRPASSVDLQPKKLPSNFLSKMMGKLRQ